VERASAAAYRVVATSPAHAAQRRIDDAADLLGVDQRAVEGVRCRPLRWWSSSAIAADALPPIVRRRLI
jgi:hypothetical protein